MSHNHFTLGFPLKSPADAKAVAEATSATDAGVVSRRRMQSAQFTTRDSQC